MIHETDVLILGAGLAGLSAASVLGDQAIVLEREARPGGLVRTHCFDGYWFDHVIHLLYFPDAQTEARIRALEGVELEPCVPAAWVETAAGTVRFPFQMHLAGLKREAILRCIADLAEVTLRRSNSPANFEELLLTTFGRGMCDVFMLPYNRKMWKRPLDTLATSGFTWNIARPDFEQVLRGAVNGGDDSFKAYNSAGWYPQPAVDAPQRGMEVLSQALARRAADLRVGCEVTLIDLPSRTVMARVDGKLERFGFESACLSSLPLPTMLALCPQTPPALLDAAKKLVRNRVMSVTLSIRGPRPQGRGHWRYYSDESLCFNRLVYMHEFDAHMAPDEGWGLLAELTEPAEQALTAKEELIARVRRDVVAAGALPAGCEIIDAHAFVVDPAYVVFTESNQQIVKQAHDFLTSNGLVPIGRYGKWEYSSMGQVMRDGFAAGEALLRKRSDVAASPGELLAASESEGR